jgi:hypothetical protein
VKSESTNVKACVFATGLRSGRVAFALVATAAFTGLRLAELRGLQWRDFTEDKLSVERTVWRRAERDIDEPAESGAPRNHPTADAVLCLPHAGTSSQRPRPPIQTGRIDSEVEGLTLLPPFTRFHLYALGVKPKVGVS